MNTCKLCGNTFLFRVIINGKPVITNRRKYCFTCSPFGKHNTKKLTHAPNSQNLKTKTCTNCKIEKPHSDFYKRNKNKNTIKPECKKCSSLLAKSMRSTCECGEPMNYRSKMCKGCRLSKNKMNPSTTLGDKTYSKHKYAQYAYIRFHAKSILCPKNNCCENCKYNKHVEVCHIRAINTFDPQTKIIDINDKSNLILLCPNCHWEFDNLKLEVNGKKKWCP